MPRSARAGGSSARGAEEALVLAFDPGRNLGAAWVRFDGTLVRLAVLGPDDLERLVLPSDAVVVVGDGTGSAGVVERLRARGLDPLLVDEQDTTLIARDLYFRDHPPHGLARLLPPGMRAPPRPIDDYAAYAIALRWLETRDA
ncbi:MAG: hypothetical protein P8Y02_07675 [Deinococcales bacterium]